MTVNLNSITPGVGALHAIIYVKWSCKLYGVIYVAKFIVAF